VSKKTVERVGIIGLGAIGKRVLMSMREKYLPNASYAAQDHFQQSDAFLDENRLTICGSADELIEWKPDLVIECAGHSAVSESVPSLLMAGIDVVIVSIGALADSCLRASLESAAKQGKARLILVSGAIGGLDALRSGRTAGLEKVVYTGRKPPQAWVGSHADQLLDLTNVHEATSFYIGNAEEASKLFPKNTNVTAAVALSGVGFEETYVELIADPNIDKNVHEVKAIGAFGEFDIRLENNPLPDNPKTSWLAALSIEEAIANQLNQLVF
jgi:aspartate dehydrogenase